MLDFQVWNMGSPEHKYTLSGHSGGVNCVDFFSCVPGSSIWLLAPTIWMPRFVTSLKKYTYYAHDIVNNACFYLFIKTNMGLEGKNVCLYTESIHVSGCFCGFPSHCSNCRYKRRHCSSVELRWFQVITKVCPCEIRPHSFITCHS